MSTPTTFRIFHVANDIYTPVTEKVTEWSVAIRQLRELSRNTEGANHFSREGRFYVQVGDYKFAECYFISNL